MESNRRLRNAQGSDSGSLAEGILGPLRTLKAQGRHARRSAELATRRPRIRYARTRPGRGGSFSRWIDVRTPIKERPGPPGINENRLHNMVLAAQHFSGIVIGPGEVFRFWRHLPRATRRNGFRTGFSLVDGQLKLNYGGGLCQVATTLFQAFLGGDLDVLERSNHSVDIHGEERFAELGRDAAVAFGYKDLIVRNPTSADVSVRSGVDRETMSYRVTLDASEPARSQVRIRSEPPPGTERTQADLIQVQTVRTSLRGGGWTETYRALDTYRRS